jgi:hypothetical protein
MEAQPTESQVGEPHRQKTLECANQAAACLCEEGGINNERPHAGYETDVCKNTSQI